MKTVSLKELQRDPNALLDRVETGEHIVIVRDGHPAAELRPLPRIQPGPRPFGLAAGELTVPDDFDAPLLDEVLRELEGRGGCCSILTYSPLPCSMCIPLFGGEFFQSPLGLYIARS